MDNRKNYGSHGCKTKTRHKPIRVQADQQNHKDGMQRSERRMDLSKMLRNQKTSKIYDALMSIKKERKLQRDTENGKKQT